jgi:prepilin-type N-terminal cleavage/methylation domain-containing protein
MGPVADARREHGTRRGFTLIEILIVIVVLGTLVAIVAPKIDVQKYRANSAMQSVGTTLLAAQRFAVSRQHNIIVAFDTAPDVVRVLDDANNNGIADPGEHRRVVALEAIVFGRGAAAPYDTYAASVTFTKRFAGLPAVTFRRDGSASEAGAVYVTTLRAAGGSSKYAGDARVILIDRATARVSWLRSTGSSWRRGF